MGERDQREENVSVYTWLSAFPALSFGILVVAGPVALPGDKFRFSRSYSLNYERSHRSGLGMLVN